MLKQSMSLLFVLYTSSACAQTCLDKNWAANGEPYSVAVCRGSDPLRFFEQANSGLLQAATDYHFDPQRSLKLEQLAKTAKAALEAGLKAKARSYAEQALTLANQDRCIDFHSRPQPENTADQAARDFCAVPIPQVSVFTSEGDAVATSSIVLGRLALLQGDVKHAEFYLAQAGKIGPGFHSSLVGPNMTLALELLKHQRQQAVLRFLDDWSKLWKGDGKSTLRRWKAAIRGGAIPDFGANLLL